MMKKLNKYLKGIQDSLLSNESLDDFISMVEIIINSRKRYLGLSTITERDIEIALASLCRWPIPGKPPEYKQDIEKFKLDFQGISSNWHLQFKFRDMLSNNLLSANSPESLNFNEVSSIFKICKNGC